MDGKEKASDPRAGNRHFNCRTDSENADAGSEPAEVQPPVDQWLAIRKEAGLKIDPKTAEVVYNWGQVLDPYGIYSDLTDEERCIGRIYFARSPGSDIWVEFSDLPDETFDELRKKVEAGDYDDDLDLPLDAADGDPI
jgi:hypothetical protein